MKTSDALNMDSFKRKTPHQLQALESFYSDDEYPTHEAMEDYALELQLTYKQVRRWFVERRRKDKREDLVLPRRANLLKLPGDGGESSCLDSACNSPGPSLPNAQMPATLRATDQRKKKQILLQDPLTPDYILKKIFRKDGPPLGIDFDSLPSKGFSNSSGSECASKRIRVIEMDCMGTLRGVDPAVAVLNETSVPVKKHGMGKGLMTVWRATNHNGGDFPTGLRFAGREQIIQERKLCQRRPVIKRRQIQKKIPEKKKKAPIYRRKLEFEKEGNKKRLQRTRCELALKMAKPLENIESAAMLVDDEELELRELQAVKSCTHFAANTLHGCSLCKDLLAAFPPESVKMKKPFSIQPWDSSPELVKKLFKVLHFIYTYAVKLDICSFTLDAFVQAFHDKDSLLLGKVHIALLKLLLCDIEAQLTNGFFPSISKNCVYLRLLHLAELQEYLVKIWIKSLNPLTWTEILRQILIAAGFGSRQGLLRRVSLGKEMSNLMRLGLRPGTSKGELFSILSEKGRNGSKVSDLAKSSQIVDLKLASTTYEVEELIYSTLSSDITLFEKISASAYRLRINSRAEIAGGVQSDTEDSGSVDNNFGNNGLYLTADESECDSTANLCHKRNNNQLALCTEIDESHPGEVWLLGLMESEYSDLSIEERLNALVALVDLLGAGSSIRMENPISAIVECVPSISHYGSGAKLKRSSAKLPILQRPTGANIQQMHSDTAHSLSATYPIDSSASIGECFQKETYSSKKSNSEVNEWEVHPMQTVLLGSDRRYNRYWLFLGPCDEDDPGHKRVYFESSEDGHWEVINTKETFSTLLSILDGRGTREAALLASLQGLEASLCQAMPSGVADNEQSRLFGHSEQGLNIARGESSSPISDVDNNVCLTEISKDSLISNGAIVLEVAKKGEEQTQSWQSLRAFDNWIWRSFYSDLTAVKHGKRSYYDSLTRCESCHDLYWRDEKHCKTCHTTFELDFDLEERYAIHAAICREKEDNNIFPKHKVLSSQLQSLKAALHAIEAAMPEGALIDSWMKSTHNLWVKRLRRTSSLLELLQVLADFVGAINEDWLCQCDGTLDPSIILGEVIESFPSLPHTSSAIALWLVKLDGFIASSKERVRLEKPDDNGDTDRGKSFCC
ncbi:WHIM1 domain, partial [Dillenia turbinata]